MPDPVVAKAGERSRFLCFRYSDEHPWVLRGLDLTIPHGAAVARVGLNGAGHGDNRPKSWGSLHYGYVPRDRMVGVVVRHVSVRDGGPTSTRRERKRPAA